MSKATSTYILMTAVFGAGLWAILSFGSILLRAPTDLSGTWELRPASEWGAEGKPVHTITIEQSGLYLQATIDGKQKRSLKITTDKVAESPTAADVAHLELIASDLKLRMEGARDADEYRMTTEGLISGEWQALRVDPVRPRSARVAKSRNRMQPAVASGDKQPLELARPADTTAGAIQKVD